MLFFVQVLHINYVYKCTASRQAQGEVMQVYI